jgi:hypothetical protein
MSRANWYQLVQLRSPLTGRCGRAKLSRRTVRFGRFCTEVDNFARQHAVLLERICGQLDFGGLAHLCKADVVVVD